MGAGCREACAGDGAPIPCGCVAPPERNRKDPFGTFHIQDVYTGPGLAGISRGTVKTLRVVAIENRPTYTYSCAMLPPYAQGSATSLLMAYFEPVHHGVMATEDEKRVVQCWIDLAIPFVGSYCEATVWTDDDRKVYDYHQKKRVLFAEKEISEINGDFHKAKDSSLD